jgi:hypothetical protein
MNVNTSLQDPDQGRWDALLLTLLLWLNKQKKALIEAPNSLGFTPSVLDPVGCRTLSQDGVVNVWCIEAFGMHLRNGLGNLLGFSSVGTALNTEYIFGCSGQWEYLLGQEGQRALKANFCSAIPPNRKHTHGGRYCNASTLMLSSGEYQDLVDGYCATFASGPTFWVSGLHTSYSEYMSLVLSISDYNSLLIKLTSGKL